MQGGHSKTLRFASEEGGEFVTFFAFSYFALLIQPELTLYCLAPSGNI
jgi:hypothetical protein